MTRSTWRRLETVISLLCRYHAARGQPYQPTQATVCQLVWLRIWHSALQRAGFSVHVMRRMDGFTQSWEKVVMADAAGMRGSVWMHACVAIPASERADV